MDGGAVGGGGYEASIRLDNEGLSSKIISERMGWCYATIRQIIIAKKGKRRWVDPPEFEEAKAMDFHNGYRGGFVHRGDFVEVGGMVYLRTGDDVANQDPTENMEGYRQFMFAGYPDDSDESGY